MTAGVLHLVRHGRTEWNKHRFLGRADLPLDEVGERQATAAAALLAHRLVDAVWSSPLRRAWHTAESIAAPHHTAPVCVPELVELDCGEWEGRPKSEVPMSLSRRDPYDPVPGGESVAAASARAERVARAVTGELLLGRHLVLVGHYLTNQLLLAALRGLPLERALHTEHRPAPGSVTSFGVELRGGRLALLPLTPVDR